MTTTGIDSRPPWRRVLERRGYGHELLPWRSFGVVDGAQSAPPVELVIDGQPRCGHIKSNGNPCRSIVRIAGRPCEWHAPASWRPHPEGTWGRIVRK
jgi:hypothetical protein